MRATAALFTLVALLAAAPAAANGERDTFSIPVDTLLPCGVGSEVIHLTGTATYHGPNNDQVTFARTLAILPDGTVVREIQVSFSCA